MRSNDALPMFDFSEKLFVDYLGFRRYGYNAGIGKSLGDYAGSKIMIRMRVGEIDRSEIFACLKAEKIIYNIVESNEDVLILKLHNFPSKLPRVFRTFWELNFQGH